MSVERSIVQDHMVAPSQAVQNGAWPCNGTNWKSRAQGLAECAEIRLDAVIFLAAAGGVAKAGHDFVQNQQRTTSVRQFVHTLQVSVSRKDATHIGHDRLRDYCCQFG